MISSALSSYLWYLSLSLLLNILFPLVKEILASSVSGRSLIGRMAGHPGTHESSGQSGLNEVEVGALVGILERSTSESSENRWKIKGKPGIWGGASLQQAEIQGAGIPAR